MNTNQGIGAAWAAMLFGCGGIVTTGSSRSDQAGIQAEAGPTKDTTGPADVAVGLSGGDAGSMGKSTADDAGAPADGSTRFEAGPGTVADTRLTVGGMGVQRVRERRLLRIGPGHLAVLGYVGVLVGSSYRYHFDKLRWTFGRSGRAPGRLVLGDRGGLPGAAVRRLSVDLLDTSTRARGRGCRGLLRRTEAEGTWHDGGGVRVVGKPSSGARAHRDPSRLAKHEAAAVSSRCARSKRTRAKFGRATIASSGRRLAGSGRASTVTDRLGRCRDFGHA
jgi:hypothetical protein